MADNVPLDALAGKAASLNATFSGDADAQFQAMALAGATGSEGSWTIGIIPGDATDGLLVNLGSNNDVINAGTFAVQEDGAALTALQLIDNTVYVDDADWTALTSSHNLIGGIYQSSPGSITDGDTGPIRLDANGAVHINDGGNSITVDGTVTANPASGTIDTVTTVTAVTDITNTIDSTISGAALTALQLIDNTVYVDDADWTALTSSHNLIGGIYQSSPGSITDGDTGPIRLDANGAIHINDGGNSITVDNAGLTELAAAINSNRVDVNIAANALGSSTYVDDADWTAVTSYHTLMGGIYQSTPGTITDGDTGPIRLDANGAVHINDGGNSITVDNGGTFAVQVDGAALTALQLIDNPIVAHDSAASGSTGVNMAGAYATNSIEGITQVANADAARITSDLNGVLITRPHTTLEEIISGQQSNTDGAEDAVTNFPAGGAGVHNYITQATVYNADSTAGYVNLLDGTGGTVLWTLPAPATGGCVQTFNPPLKQPTANTQLYFDPDAAHTTIYVSLNGFQAQG